MHPDTYLNKVLLGSQEGALQLWNNSTKKMLFEFKGWKSSICCCVSSPALDVVTVGCSDGKIHVHNIRYDKEIGSFTHSTRGAVTALSFSTDKKLSLLEYEQWLELHVVLILELSTPFLATFFLSNATSIPITCDIIRVED